MVEKKKVVSKGPRRLPEEKRCQHVYEDGRRCGNRRWAGKKLCFQHDEAAAPSRKAKPDWAKGQTRMMTAGEVHEVLAMTLAQVMLGSLPVGRAYAIGYLAQLMLAAQGAVAREKKLDVKHLWEMVELGATLEKAKELQEEKEREKKEAEKAEEAAERE